MIGLFRGSARAAVLAAGLFADASAASPEDDSALRRRDSIWFAANPRSQPRWETLVEREARMQRRRPGTAVAPAAPHPTVPAGPLRVPAEFERMAGVIVRYPFGIGDDLLRELAGDVLLYCLAASSDRGQAQNALAAAGVAADRFRLIEHATDSYWTRDYSPWILFDGNGRPGLVDFTYNRPRPGDDAAAGRIGAALGLPVYFMDLLHCGGNFMADGHRLGASTDLVLEENRAEKGLAAETVRARMEASLGIREYATPADPTGAYIKHIDTWAKFLAADKVMIRRVPPGHARYADIERAVDSFRFLRSAQGTPFRIHRVDTPRDEPYANSLILNDKVLVALTGGSQDEGALRAYRQAMPGYRVMGFRGDWLSTDALHCRTFGVADPGMLRIVHAPLHDTVASGPGGFAIEAEVRPHSGKGLVPDSLFVAFRTAAGGTFAARRLEKTAAGTYTARIPALAMPGEIAYYLHAADSSGRSEHHPFAGPADPHRFFAAVSPTGLLSRAPRQAGGPWQAGSKASRIAVQGSPRFDLRGRRLNRSAILPGKMH